MTRLAWITVLVAVGLMPATASADWTRPNTITPPGLAVGPSDLQLAVAGDGTTLVGFEIGPDLQAKPRPQVLLRDRGGSFGTVVSPAGDGYGDMQNVAGRERARDYALDHSVPVRGSSNPQGLLPHARGVVRAGRGGTDRRRREHGWQHS